MALTFNNSIRQDLEDLLYNHEISKAIALNNAGILTENVSTKGLPTFFTGKRDAKTVLVMLNPGCDAIIADHNYPCDICKLKIDDKHGLSTFVNDYIDASTNFGRRDHWRYDTFDIKQAQILYPWKDSEIKFPTGFPSNPNSYLDAKEAVLMQKLQLELVPYCSRTFAINKIEQLIPYVKMLFDVIASCERRYVIFCSSMFERLFKVYSKKYYGSISGLSGIPKENYLVLQNGMKTKRKYKCRKIAITYNHHTFDAMIVHSFPMQGLNGDLMRQYGQFCYNHYLKSI